MNWKQIKKKAFESENGKYDFHIRKEEENWVLDVFNAQTNDSNNAYIETFVFSTINEAKQEAELYI